MPEDEVDPITVTGKRRLWGIRFGPYSPPPEPPLPGDTAELPPTEPGEPQEHPEDREKKHCAAKEFREKLEEENRDQSE